MLPVIPLFPAVEPIVTLPPFKVVMLPTKLNIPAETLTLPSKLEAPVNVVVPAPAVWLKAFANRVLEKLTSVAETILMSPSRLTPAAPPTAPTKLMFPVPAVSVRLLSLFEPRVELKATVPLDNVFTSTLPFNVVALTKVTLSPVVVISPAVLIPVDPVNDTVPPEVISPAAKMVKAPADAARVTVPAPTFATEVMAAPPKERAPVVAVIPIFPAVEVIPAVVVTPVLPVIVTVPLLEIAPPIVTDPAEDVRPVAPPTVALLPVA